MEPETGLIHHQSWCSYMKIAADYRETLANWHASIPANDNTYIYPQPSRT
jgi:hypothetical protein